MVGKYTVFLFIAFFIAFLIACFVGYGKNIYKFTKCDFEEPYKAEVMRGLGVLPLVPVGVIVGYLEIDDTPSIKRVRIVK